MSTAASAPTHEPPMVVQRSLRVGAVDDPLEKQADAVADRVMRMPDPAPALVQRCPGGCGDEDDVHRSPAPATPAAARGPLGPDAAAGIRRRRGSGTPLPAASRRFFEPRFGADFASVRVHADAGAADLARQVHARAFTVGRDLFFGAGQWRPGCAAGDRLLAHELAHTLQQRDGRQRLRRTVELRPPGRGEASAFDRAHELVDRLNAVSVPRPGDAPPITYRLDADGRTLQYEVSDEAALATFDRQMMSFIDAGQVIPLRLITRAGRARDQPVGPFLAVTADQFVSGYVDLDDLMAADDTAFKLMLVHFITERLQVPNYARRIGTNINPLFARAHAAGIEAEVALLRGLLNDPSVRLNYQELRPDGTTFVRAFRSADEGYRVFFVIRSITSPLSTSVVHVRTADGRRMSFEDFLAQRAAAAAGP